jgi:hypothetical protein
MYFVYSKLQFQKNDENLINEKKIQHCTIIQFLGELGILDNILVLKSEL